MSLKKKIKKKFKKEKDKAEKKVRHAIDDVKDKTKHARKKIDRAVHKYLGPVGHAVESMVQRHLKISEKLGGKWLYDELMEHKGLRTLAAPYHILRLSGDEDYAEAHGVGKRGRIQAGALFLGTAAITVASLGAAAAAGGAAAVGISSAISVGTKVGGDLAPEKYQPAVAAVGAVASLATGALGVGGLGSTALGVLPQTTKAGALALVGLAGQGLLQGAAAVPVQKDAEDALKKFYADQAAQGGMRSIAGPEVGMPAPSKALGMAAPSLFPSMASLPTSSPAPTLAAPPTVSHPSPVTLEPVASSSKGFAVAIVAAAVALFSILG